MFTAGAHPAIRQTETLKINIFHNTDSNDKNAIPVSAEIKQILRV